MATKKLSSTKTITKKTATKESTSSSKISKKTSSTKTVAHPALEKTKKKPVVSNMDSLSIDFVEVIPDDTEEEVVLESKKKEISHVGYKKLLDELHHLEIELLPTVNERIKEAREYGDLSENAEYQSAINEKQMIDVRMVELEDIIANS